MSSRLGPRLGVFGGTFDPPHIGHLLAASEVRDQLGLDRVLLVVANDPWQKRDRVLTPAPLRVEMVEAAVSDLDGLEASDIEIARGGPSYTFDTIAELGAAVVILGADAAARLDTWHRADELANVATFAVVDRPGTPTPTMASRWRINRVEIPQIDVSSTQLRDRIAHGRSTAVLLAPRVRDIVDREGLYRLGS